MQVDITRSEDCVDHPFSDMSTSEQPTQQSLTPDQIPFTTPQAMRSYVTDTGKILPRKYTHLSAKQQRAITKSIKQSRNMLLAL
jgi:small subunit ribosomal protein S18